MRPYKNRDQVRFANEAPIMFSICDQNPYSYYGGKLIDYSRSGLSFVTPYALEPGRTVSIRRAKYLPDRSSLMTGEYDLAAIRWCRRLSEVQADAYGVGVQNLDPMADTPAGDEFWCRPVDTGRPAAVESDTFPDQRLDELEILNRISTAVSSSLNLATVLDTICQLTVPIFRSRNSGICLFENQNSHSTVIAFHSDDPQESDATGLQIPIAGNAATVFVLETGLPIVIPDAQHNPLFKSLREMAWQRDTHCMLIVPLKTKKGEVIGTLGLPTSDPHRIFTRAEVRLADKIASLVTNAVDNARQYAKSEHAKMAAEQELEIGRRIQADFFPLALPATSDWDIVAHFQAARQVAGDFYDLFALPGEKRIAVMIGDVCDKGVGAALYMALFRSLLRAFTLQVAGGDDGTEARSDCGSVDLLQRVTTWTNDYIATQHERAGMFATIFCGILDTASGRLTYVNGGHEAPLILRSGNRVETLDATGPAVGAFPEAEFAWGRIRLNPGDFLVAFTDGVTEAHNPQGQLFDRRRMLAACSHPPPAAAALLDRLLERLHQHMAGSAPFDDVTLVVMRRMQSL